MYNFVLFNLKSSQLNTICLCQALKVPHPPGLHPELNHSQGPVPQGLYSPHLKLSEADVDAHWSLHA